MSNNVLLPPEEVVTTTPTTLNAVDSVHLSGHLGAVDENVFHSLIGSIRDVFFPKKLPPLVLESTPIPVVDRMAVKRDPVSAIISTVINVAIVLFVLWFAARQTGLIQKAKTVELVNLDAPLPKAPPKLQTMGGGGGQKGPTPVSK